MIEVPFVRIDASAADDPLGGFALVLYVAGCPRECPGCQNPQLRDASAYTKMNVEEVLMRCRALLLDDNNLVESVAFSGGDWMMYPDAYFEIARWALGVGYRTVLYTGELYEHLPERVKSVSLWVIDGPYDETKSSVFPASSNQRVFRNGILVAPETLPLYEHLLELQSVKTAKQGGTG